MVIGVLVGLVIIAAGVVAFLLLTREGTTEAAPRPVVASSNSPAESAPPASEQPSEAPSEPTEPSNPPPAEGSSGASQAPTSAAPPPSAAPWPPTGTTLCEENLAVNSVTSCPFATEVRATYHTHGPGTYDVFSPVTGREHTMTCGDPQAGVVRCHGGTDAVLYFR